MTLEQIMQLGAMGYTKADIEALEQTTAGNPAPAPAPIEQPKQETVTLTQEQLEKLMGANEAPKAEPTPATPAQEPEAPKQTTLSDAQFEKLLQGLRAKGTNIDIPEKVELEDKLADRFKALLGASDK